MYFKGYQALIDEIICACMCSWKAVFFVFCCYWYKTAFTRQLKANICDEADLWPQKALTHWFPLNFLSSGDFHVHSHWCDQNQTVSSTKFVHAVLTYCFYLFNLLQGYLMLVGRWRSIKWVEVAWRAWISHMMLKARCLRMISEQMPTLTDYSSVRSFFWLLVWSTVHLLSPLEMHRDLELKRCCSDTFKPFNITWCCPVGLLKTVWHSLE